MSITSWYRNQREHFQSLYYADSQYVTLLQHNGWFGNTDIHPATSAFLNVVDRPGTILDLGCGNGLLLRSLIEFSSFPLIPFGVDFLCESIQEAKSCVLPQFARNFTCGNIATFDFTEPMSPTYILLCPVYLHPSHIETFLAKCISHVDKQAGRLILYEYDDVKMLSDFDIVVDRDGNKFDARRTTGPFTRIAYYDRGHP